MLRKIIYIQVYDKLVLNKPLTIYKKKKAESSDWVLGPSDEPFQGGGGRFANNA